MNLTTLEQSKKLKEWGAPQDTERSWYLNPYNVNTDFILETTSKVADVRYLERYAAYDLESLIAWLGDGIEELSRVTNPYYCDKKWCASNGDTVKPVEGLADTPLEAVYSLARALPQPND